jgi:hypothetical protein
MTCDDETREKVARAIHDKAWDLPNNITAVPYKKRPESDGYHKQHSKAHWRELADAAIAAYEAAQWREIESAPKDGTEILVWGDWTVEEPECMIMAQYDAEHGQWYEVLEGCPFCPTHWRPLPPPPA